MAAVAEPSFPVSGAQLRGRLDGLTIRDAARLGRRLKKLRGAAPDKLRQLADQIAAAEAVVAARHAAVRPSAIPICRSASGAGRSPTQYARIRWW